jgi:hypothetical protein
MLQQLFQHLFQPQHGAKLVGYMIGALLAGGVVMLLLQQTPPRLRRPLIFTVTLLGGLFFAVEFFWPVHPMPTQKDLQAVGNFLTRYVQPFGSISPVIQGFAVGLGVINLLQVHGKRLHRGGEAAFNSLAFFISMFLMLIIVVLQKAHPNTLNTNLKKLLFDGALQSLDATMFSIIAFYIVSAAYRAFRVRSVEASFLLITAVIVMLGQIPVGIFLTHALPHYAHVEAIRNWILTVTNTAASRAIAFGLGIGSLAVALRIWLGLERGSYFDNQ